MMATLVPLVVLVPLLAAALTLVLGRRARPQRIVALLALVSVLTISIALLIGVDSGEAIVVEAGGWPAPFGIVLVVDRLSALMLVVSSLVLLAVLVFSVGQGLADGDDETPVSIYYPTYLILTTGVMVAFIAGDLFNLYVGFEILLVASYVLITLGGTATRIRAGITYVIVSLMSSILFLAAIGMVYGALGTVNLAQVAERVQDLPTDVQILLHVMLLVAFGIKAAVFPLSFWLPDSYPSAPAPVTAVFAGLLTKIGVYAIIRVETVIFPTPELNPALMVLALLTMVVGALGSVAQADIKRILSFTLVSHIGYMILGVSLGTVAGTAAAIYYIMHHIVVQTTLFLAAGLIEREAGSTSITKVGGLLASAPLVAGLFFIPALSLGGIPPFSGFIGKLALFQAAAEQGDALAYTLMGSGALVSLLTLYTLMRVWNLVFWRPAKDVKGDDTRLLLAVEEAPLSTSTLSGTRATPRLMTLSTAAMVAVGLALTVFAGPIYGVAARAAENLDGPSDYIELVFPGSADLPALGVEGSEP
jgi:multicomponent Na+:H+ antiporter subunit D